LSEGKFAVRCSSPLLLVWAGSFGFELVEANSPLLLLWAGSFGFELVEADLGSANFLDEEGATRGFFVATAVDMMGAAWGGATGVEVGTAFFSWSNASNLQAAISLELSSTSWLSNAL
jgi:hypothetical protein